MSVQSAIKNASELSGSGIQQQWKKCLELIKDKVPWQTFQTWFLPIIPVSFVERKVILRVPSQFFFEWIDSHYSELLSQVVAKVIGRAAKIEYIIATSSKDSQEPEIVETEPEVMEGLTGKDYPPADEECEVEPCYTFQNFFAGKENQLAWRAAEHVANHFGKAGYNPLVVYGEVGTGKTHLLHAIGNHIIEHNRKKRVVLMSSEHFLHEYIYNLQNRNINKFKRKLIQADVFLLDDLQFLSNKEKSQELVLYIVSELAKKKRQIVITSNTAPGRLIKFNPKLISFLQKGLIVDLVPPACETREKIVKEHLQRSEIELEPEIIDFLIDNLTHNMHLLNAAMMRIIAQISLLGKPLSLDEARFIVAQIYPQWQGVNGLLNGRKGIHIENIINTVSQYFNIPPDILTGSSRKREVLFARQIAIYLSRELTGETLASIGYHFGDRYHATVLYTCNKIKTELKKNPILKISLQQIKDQLIE